MIYHPFITTDGVELFVNAIQNTLSVDRVAKEAKHYHNLYDFQSSYECLPSYHFSTEGLIYYQTP